jgi:hypothetical protein
VSFHFATNCWLARISGIDFADVYYIISPRE